VTFPELTLAKLGEFRNGLNYSKENFGNGLKVVSVRRPTSATPGPAPTSIGRQAALKKAMN
jgi:hypothetical protein